MNISYATFSFLPSDEEAAAEAAKEALHFKPKPLLCTTCTHHRWNIFGFDKCVSPRQRADYVSGKRVSFCNTNRRFDHCCGHDARWHSTNEKNRVIWIAQHGDVDAKEPA